jgi:hypothetical protein
VNTEQREKWIAEYSDIESPLEASATLKQALPMAARVVVNVMNDEDAGPRLRFDAAKYVIERGIPQVSGKDTGEPWKGLLDDVKKDVEDGEEEAQELLSDEEADAFLSEGE